MNSQAENRAHDVKAIFLAALEKTAGPERTSYLDTTCGGDAEVRREVESLLLADQRAGEFLDPAAFSMGMGPGESALTEAPGTVIGRYKLLEKIGEGGMAVVYMAEQTEPVRRKVALKIIKLGMDTRQVIARFEAERQALAMMDHPNIAKVLDAGATETGRPYFVMELVTGVSITEYCDANNLSTKDRLALFIQTCNAVQHAHQKGIIHRDIKPSNVMVAHRDGVPVPKVIDFGIAKATNQRLTEKTLFTRYAHLIGTPAYMSPEQAELSDLDIDTRSDIYSLGVLLYELLTGTTPFSEEQLRKAGYLEMQRIVREEEPAKPSTKLRTLGETLTDVAKHRNASPDVLTRAVRGDLDWIVMKTLEKDRRRRYETAHALAEDVRRHLNHEPVQAGSPGIGYLVKKYVYRHRTQLASTVVICLMLVLVIAPVHALRQSRQQREAMAQQNRRLQASQHLSNAERLRAEGYNRQALAQLQSLFEQGAAVPRAHLLHAQLLYDMDRLTEAEEVLQRPLYESPETAGAAHALLARIYTTWESRQADEHRRLAESLLQQTAEAYSLRALVADTPEEAVTWLDKALALEPDHFAARKARALGHYALGDLPSMALDAEAIIATRPQDIMGYALRAMVRQKTENLDQAIEDITRAIELSNAPREPARLHDRRRAFYVLTRDHRAALQDAERCIALEPEELKYHFNHFAALLALGRHQEAIQAYDTFVGTDPLREYGFWFSLMKHAFHLMAAGQSISFPAEVAHHRALSAMQEATHYYHHLAAKAKCLVPQTLGHASWSPDGRQIAYNKALMYPQGVEALAARMPAMPGPGGIEILNLDSKARRPLVSFGTDPMWSPDGKWIAFIKTQKGTWGGMNDEVWIVETAGSAPRRLAKGTWPFWGRDTQRLYFLTRDENMLYRIGVDEPAATPERVISCSGWYPALSPDERYLAYAVGSELRLADLSTGTVTTAWTAPGHQTDMHVKWSPRGNQLSVGGTYGSQLGVWIFDMQTRQAWNVFDPPAYKLIWSADGSRVALHVHQPFEEIWWAPVDPNVPTYQALAPARTCRDYLRRQRDQRLRAGEAYGRQTHETLKDLALVAADQCRLGDYQGALETLADGDTLRASTSREPRPWDVALQALTLFQIGEIERARAGLGRLRGVLAGTTTAAQQCVHDVPVPVPTVNSRGREYAPTIAADSLSLLFTSSRGGQGSQDLWVATRSSASDDWGPAENLGPPVNTAACEAHPCLATDGLSLYFCDGRGDNDMPRRPGGLGKSDIWVATRPTANDRWTEPVNLGPVVNSEYHERAPCISSDGLSLFFDSDRPGGLGGSDIWAATRSRVQDPWGGPVNLGPPVNSVGWEGEPCVADGGSALYFSCLRTEGYGRFDIWVARRTTTRDAWGTAVSLGPLVNTSWADVGPEVSADASTLYFCSRRPGGPGFWDLWQVPLRQSAIDLTPEATLLRRAESVVEAEFGKGVLPRQN